MTVLQAVHDVIIRDVRFRPGTVAVNGTNTVAASWANGFEGGSSPINVGPLSYFAGGWHVDFYSVDWLTTPTGPASSGSWYINLDGSLVGGGGISTNIPTVPGVTYTLAFAYTKDPLAVTPKAQVSINNGPVLTVAPIIATTTNNLNWQTTNYVFTATDRKSTRLTSSH